VALSVFCSRLWRSTSAAHVAAGAGKLHRLALLTTALVYLQLVVGSQLRHVAPDAAAATFRLAVVFHLVLAAAVVVHAALLLLRVGRHYRNFAAIWRPAIGLLVLVLVQLVLGSATWVLKYGWPGGFFADRPLVAGWTNAAGTLGQSMIVTAHVALGSLILATSLLVALRSLRLVRRPQAVADNAAAMTPGDSPGAKTASGHRFVGVAL
jgi:cytochrome c oxidase assembly protein subunit 15